MRSRSVSRPLLEVVLLAMLCAQCSPTQTVKQYVVKRATSPVQIDGYLSEADWAGATWTDPFLLYSSPAHFRTQAKMLWDDTYLYIAFVCQDSSLWTTYTQRDGNLYRNDVVEVFCDPDGDGLNYCELEVNPLNVVADLTLNKPYSSGGSSNWAWNLDSMKTAVWVDGTVNVLDSLDKQWICEMAVPFKGIKSLAPTKAFPPHPGDSWRIQLARQDYVQGGSTAIEQTTWNPTDAANWPHVPSKFGQITFSGDPVSAVNAAKSNDPTAFALLGNYPNPFNPSTDIRYSVPRRSFVTLTVYSMLGQYVTQLVHGEIETGIHQVRFDAAQLSSGLYFCRLSAGDCSTGSGPRAKSSDFVQTMKVLLVR